MMEHPLTVTPLRRTLFTAGILAVGGVQALLLHGYTGSAWPAAASDGMLSAAFLATLLYLSWFVIRFTGIPGIALLSGIVSLSVWAAGCFVLRETVVQLTGSYDAPYALTLPFRLIFAIPAWIAVTLWYRLDDLHGRQTGEAAIQEHTDPAAPAPLLPAEEYIDRISVKDGTRIHLILVGELLYIQACGDYVALFTPDGQYIKEQTMKYFETHLPPGIFIRIHRSTLVNATRLSRVELSGKDNYQVTLKNGTKLKVSLSGYQLLKERLGL